MTALAVPVETSPHPLTLDATEIETVAAAGEIMRASASANVNAGEGNSLRPAALASEVEHAAAIVERWQQADAAGTDAGTTEPLKKEILVDGWEIMAVAFAAPRAKEAGLIDLADKLEALWERWLKARDRHLDEQPAAVRELRYLMSEISEITDWASWVDGTPYTCWELAEGTSRHQDEVAVEIVERLRELRDRAGGWWTWPGLDFLLVDWSSPDPLFVPLDEWRQHVAKTDSREQIRDLLRWTSEAFPEADVPSLDDVFADR